MPICFYAYNCHKRVSGDCHFFLSRHKFFVRNFRLHSENLTSSSNANLLRDFQLFSLISAGNFYRFPGRSFHRDIYPKENSILSFLIFQFTECRTVPTDACVVFLSHALRSRRIEHVFVSPNIHRCRRDNRSFKMKEVRTKLVLIFTTHVERGRKNAVSRSRLNKDEGANELLAITDTCC